MKFAQTNGDFEWRLAYVFVVKKIGEESYWFKEIEKFSGPEKYHDNYMSFYLEVT